MTQIKTTKMSHCISVTGLVFGTPTQGDLNEQQPVIVGVVVDDGRGGRTGSIFYIQVGSGQPSGSTFATPGTNHPFGFCFWLSGSRFGSKFDSRFDSRTEDCTIFSQQMLSVEI